MNWIIVNDQWAMLIQSSNSMCRRILKW